MRIGRYKSNLKVLFRRPAVFARSYRWALSALLAGAILDGLTTYASLRKYGPEAEVHAVGRMLFQIVGLELGVPLAKLVQVVAAIFVASLFRAWCGWLMLLAGLSYALAALANHFELL